MADKEMPTANVITPKNHSLLPTANVITLITPITPYDRWPHLHMYVTVPIIK